MTRRVPQGANGSAFPWTTPVDGSWHPCPLLPRGEGGGKPTGCLIPRSLNLGRRRPPQSPACHPQLCGFPRSLPSPWSPSPCHWLGLGPPILLCRLSSLSLTMTSLPPWGRPFLCEQSPLSLGSRVQASFTTPDAFTQDQGTWATYPSCPARVAFTDRSLGPVHLFLRQVLAEGLRVADQDSIQGEGLGDHL